MILTLRRVWPGQLQLLSRRSFSAAIVLRKLASNGRRSSGNFHKKPDRKSSNKKRNGFTWTRIKKRDVPDEKPRPYDEPFDRPPDWSNNKSNRGRNKKPNKPNDRSDKQPDKPNGKPKKKPRLSRHIKIKDFSLPRWCIKTVKPMAIKVEGFDNPLQLTTIEAKIQDMLVRASRWIDAEDKNRKENLVLRFTGGWVRDKILGLENHDIDVSINRMTGYEFADAMQKFTQREKMYKPAMSGYIKITMNPDKSKHLETTTTKLFGQNIDLVNLRSEEYTDASRIPAMRFGTPEEDAFRRDATINALFYNIMSRQVEDLTGMGLDDLRNKIVRTPLEPRKTFLDDPLRVMRLIRFAAKLEFEIEAETEAAMSLPEILEALREKISRERIGLELSKIISGPHPERGLLLIESLGISDVIFQPMTGAAFNGQKRPTAIKPFVEVITDLMSREAVPILGPRFGLKHYPFLPVYFYAAVHQWGATQSQLKETKTVVFYLIRDSVKLSAAVANEVAAIAIHADKIAAMAAKQEYTRKEIGFLVRECGEHWRIHFFCSLAHEIYKLRSAAPEDPEEAERLYQALMKQYLDLEFFIESENLTEAYRLRLIFDGNHVMDLLKTPSGPFMKQALNEILGWQFENPEGTRQECEEYLLSIKDKLLPRSIEGDKLTE